MNFRRLRFSEKATGTLVRKLDVQVTNLTKNVETEDTGLVVFSNVEGSVYMAMELVEFNKRYVENWLSKKELGLEESETPLEKLNDFIDDVQETVTDIVDEVKEGISDVAEDIKDVANDVKETVEDIKDILDGDNETKEVKPKAKKKATTKKK